MKPLASRVGQAALWALVIGLLAGTLATVDGASAAASTSYHLIGFVDQPGGLGAPPVPAGVQVELISRATGSVYTTTTTGAGGEFEFTTSGTSNALAPGYWGIVVPPQANVSLTHCGQCAVLPLSQNPRFAYFNSTELLNATYSITIPNVSILPYNATLNGTVLAGGAPDAGAVVSVLDPVYNGLVLANATSNATGIYGPLHVPEGTWVVQTVQVSGATTLTNTSNLTISMRNQTLFSPKLFTDFLSGRILSATGDVPNPGNATLYDPLNHLVYSTTTPPGGYYGFATYPDNFQSGANSFDVILAANGYETTWFTQAVNATPSPVSHSVHVTPITPGEMGIFNTTLDFATVNVSNGSGTLNVTTLVTLGNDSVLPNLPNATVGQLWAQLGLDYNHSLVFPAGDKNEVEAFVNSSGPFFPAPQAGTSVNGTGFVAPNTTLGVADFVSHCTTTCGLDSDAGISYAWGHTYTLNGTVPVNASTYVIGLDFQHPTSSAEVYNYSFELPKGYVLTAGTAAPAHAALVPTGPDGTWSSFTLVSKPSVTVPATARFTIVKLGTPTPIVNVTVDNFAFSKANVLNSTEGNYSIVVGKDQNVTFSSANSIYPAGTNATSFVWDFGDGSVNVTTNNTTTNHTYTHLPTGTNYTGVLTIHSSGGKTNTTKFHVYVVAPIDPVANISSNASNNYSIGGENYLVVNWSTSLYFNATFSRASTPNVISIAHFKLTSANGFNESANFSIAAGASNESNWTVQFNGVNGSGSYVTDGDIGGHQVPFEGGWQYNLTLEVWSATGQSNNTTIAILVNDTKPPTASFEMLNAVGKPVPSTGLIEGTNGTAIVRLNASASNNPNGSQIVSFSWTVNNTASGFTNFTKNLTRSTPYFQIALAPETPVYTIRLNVTDANGISANETQNLSVSPNATTRPILETTNLTSLSGTTLIQGTSYTFWVNVTVGGGVKSAAKNLTVNWYLLGPAGTGSRMYFSGSPGSTVFYNYTSKGVVSTTAWTTVGGVIGSLPYGKTVRAEITWDAPVTGNFILYANATSTNEFPPDYGTANIASIAIAVHPSVTTELLEYGGIAAVVVAVIVALIWWYRRRGSRRGAAGSGKSTTGKSGLERGGRKGSSDDDS